MKAIVMAKATQGVSIIKSMGNWNLFDHYSLRARLQPALLTLLPLALGAFAWVGPGDRALSALWTLFGSVGGTYFLAVVARNRGKEIEPNLWASWGGTPTTQLLRHSGSANPIMRERWHNHLARLLGQILPSPEVEKADPASADRIYEAGVKLLIIKTRENKTTLFYKENVQYGFCRNLYAMKSVGIVISLAGTIASSAAGFWFVHCGRPQILPWFCAAISLFLFIGWVSVVRASWVKVPAFAYAERLLESTDKVTRAKGANSGSRDREK
jgi:hypothetical protein